jgi:transcriptional regulator with XRE-family HTH domain
MLCFSTSYSRSAAARNSYFNSAFFLLRSETDWTYFNGKSLSPGEMYFEVLQGRLIAHVHARVQRGEVTERALARHTGISQPHLHNVPKGVRVLSPQMADLLLHRLHITLVDLLSADELAARRPTDHSR